MPRFRLLLLLVFSFILIGAHAQRYLTEQFVTYDVVTNRPYGINYTVAFAAAFGGTVQQHLTMDVYLPPQSDLERERPLVILLPNTQFLGVNNTGLCYGTNKDAYIVNLAGRLAKMGYVVAAINHRLGWNLLANTEIERRFTWINALYRGVQDARTAVRFFRRNVLNADNLYGIDEKRIMLWGLGTGGFVASAAATLDATTDTQTPLYSNDGKPMVIEIRSGNPDATGIHGINVFEAQYPGIPLGDTLCTPNHVGYSSDVAFVVNSGGALADLGWLDNTDAPMLSFHLSYDANVPCGTAVYNTPYTGTPLTTVSGSCAMMEKVNQLGLNSVFKENTISDPITTIANQRSGGQAGLFLFPRTAEPNVWPWEYAASSSPFPGSSNCKTDATEANLYLDTMVQYFAPRAVNALNLPNPCGNASTIVYVDASATGAGNGSSWTDAFTTIEASLAKLNACGTTTTIHIAGGTYTPTGTLQLGKLNAQLLGGFPPGGGTRNPAANPVTIKGAVNANQSLIIDGIILAPNMP